MDDAALSPDGRLFAVTERGRFSRSAPYGISLFDAKTGEFNRRVIPPVHEHADKAWARQPEFVRGLLTFLWRTIESDSAETRWYVNLNSREAKPYQIVPALPAPLGYEIDHDRHYTRGAVDVEAWIAKSETSSDHLCMVQVGPEPRLKWTKTPGSAKFRGATADAVPGHDALVWMLPHAALLNAIPQVWRAYGADSWQEDQYRMKWHWHDWSSNEWTEFGCPPETIIAVARSDALITVAMTGDRTFILQSWPLPPRDPKWPALGIAALCTAATWSMCAWRYRKRTRLASAGAA
jgi:hypothetical protein